MTGDVRKRQEAVEVQSNDHKLNDTKRTQVIVLKDEPTTTLDAIALLLGLTVVALLFNTVAPHAYMVSTIGFS